MQSATYLNVTQKMIIGDPSTFAIESHITKAYSRLGFLALGFFVLHIGGRRYGVHAPDASLLAVALDVIAERLASRGTHTAPFSSESDSREVFDAIADAFYAPEDNTKRFFGMSQSELGDLASERHLMWPAPDEAFDDNTAVLQFDVDDRVRLIATNGGNGWRHNPETLRDVWMSADDFYRVLQQWHDAFVAEWGSASKIPEKDDGAELLNSL